MATPPIPVLRAGSDPHSFAKLTRSHSPPSQAVQALITPGRRRASFTLTHTTSPRRNENVSLTERRIEAFLKQEQVSLEQAHFIFNSGEDNLCLLDGKLLRRFYEAIALICLEHKYIPDFLAHDNCEIDMLASAVAKVHFKERTLFKTIRVLTQDDKASALCAKIIMTLVNKQFSKSLDPLVKVIQQELKSMDKLYDSKGRHNLEQMVFYFSFQAFFAKVAKAVFELEPPAQFCRLMYDRKMLFEDECESRGLSDLFFLCYLKHLLINDHRLEEKRDIISYFCGMLLRVVDNEPLKDPNIEMIGETIRPLWRDFTARACERGKEEVDRLKSRQSLPRRRGRRGSSNRGRGVSPREEKGSAGSL